MRGLGAVGLAAIAVALGGACHFDTSFRFDARVDPGGPGDLFRDACREQALGACSYQARCLPFGFERAWPDAATCEERETLGCQLEAADPSSTYDDASIRSCALPLDFPCPSDPGHDAAVAAQRAACNPPPGELPDGASCAFGSACASGFCWPYVSDWNELCGQCMPRPCEGGCPEGEVCTLSLADLSSTCVPRGGVGEPCEASDECATYVCDGGVCAPRPEVGDPCDPGLDACESEAYCDPAVKVCRLSSLAQASEPCGALPSGFTLCGGGAACPSLSSSATCIPPAEDGSFCDPTQSLDCLWPALCVDGYCRFDRPLCAPPG